MRLEVATATASGQIKNSTDRVKSIEWHAREANYDAVTVGMSDVTLENGRQLMPGESVTWNFALADREGSMPLSAFYVAVSGDSKVDWSVIKE